MTEYKKMINGELYYSSDSELKKMRKHSSLLTEKINKLSTTKTTKRNKLFKQLFGSTGENIEIGPNFYCDYGIHIHVGNNFYANYNCVILDVAEVIIGDNCLIAPQVGIYTATHPIDPIQRNSGLEYGRRIVIGNNCWIGGNSTINPGVTLGNNVIVASGSVVTKSFGDNVIIAGVPAKIIKTI